MKIFYSCLVFTGLILSSCGEAPPKETPTEEASVAGIVDVDAEKASALVEEESDLVVLDVRTPEEFAEGHLAGAVNIDFKKDDFAAKVGELDTEKPYLVHCRSGSRSGKSMEVFKDLDFEEIYHLKTGYLGWTEAGKPVEK